MRSPSQSIAGMRWSSDCVAALYALRLRSVTSVEPENTLQYRSRSPPPELCCQTAAHEPSLKGDEACASSSSRTALLATTNSGVVTAPVVRLICAPYTSVPRFHTTFQAAPPFVFDTLGRESPVVVESATGEP